MRPRRSEELRLDGPRGPCLVLHGHRGLPGHVEPLCRALAGQGFAVYAPLLEGHAREGDPPSLAEGWDEWLRQARDWARQLSAAGKPHLIGLSLGGALCLAAAAEGVAASVTCLAAPALPGALEALPEVTCPVLLVHGRADDSVPPVDALTLAGGLTGPVRVELIPGAAHLLTLGPGRDRLAELVGGFLSGLEAQGSGGSDGWCFACGRRNPIGLKLSFAADGDGCVTRFTPSRLHEGWPGVVHGGIVATLLDEVMGHYLYTLGLTAVTADLRIRYRKPAPVGETLTVRGRTIERRGRRIRMAAALQAGAVTAADAEATYIMLDDTGPERPEED